MVNKYTLLRECSGFDWDEHNMEKNWDCHKVLPGECEQIFFNQPLIIAGDAGHSQSEQRFYALGKTDNQRKLFIAFTARGKLIRVISARDMTSKETGRYKNHEKE